MVEQLPSFESPSICDVGNLRINEDSIDLKRFAKNFDLFTKFVGIIVSEFTLLGSEVEKFYYITRGTKII